MKTLLHQSEHGEQISKFPVRFKSQNQVKVIFKYDRNECSVIKMTKWELWENYITKWPTQNNIIRQIKTNNQWNRANGIKFKKAQKNCDKININQCISIFYSNIFNNQFWNELNNIQGHNFLEYLRMKWSCCAMPRMWPNLTTFICLDYSFEMQINANDPILTSSCVSSSPAAEVGSAWIASHIELDANGKEFHPVLLGLK